MANPLRAAWDYLRGADLQPPRTPLPAPGAATKTQPVLEQKLYYNTDVGAAIRLGTLVHGPGASELLGMAYGAGQAANSAVFACLSTICTAYTEAQPRVYRLPRDGGTPEVLPEHPLEVLLDEPNPALTGIELRWWTQWALKVDGNAYWHKARAGDGTTGNVVALWPRSPGTIAPITTKADRQRGVFVSFYRWEYETGKYQDIPPENVVHFRAGLDDYDLRLGCSALKRLLRQVSTDEEATAFTDALLKNYAVPGLVAQAQGDLDEATADAIKQKLSTKFGSGNQGNVAVLDNGMTLASFGFSPQQMDMKTLHRVPEERIAAVLGVPAIVAGLGAGLVEHGLQRHPLPARIAHGAVAGLATRHARIGKAAAVARTLVDRDDLN
jgi:HK97 family phage portal protein